MPGGPGTTIVVENSGREEVRSPDSSTYGDDSHVRTLDYLGLDGDSPIGGFGPFTEKPVERSAGTIGDAGRSHLQAPGMHRLGSMGDLSSLSSLSEVAEAHQGRMRSNTVATFPRASDLYRPLPPPTSSSFASIPNGVRVNEAVNEAEEEYFGDATSSYHRSTDSNDSTRLLYSTATSTVTQDVDGFSDLLLLRPETSSSRARAATIGILDDTRETFLRKRAGTTTGITPSHSTAFSSENENGTTGSLYPAANVLVRGMRSLSIGQEEVGCTLTDLHTFDQLKSCCYTDPLEFVKTHHSRTVRPSSPFASSDSKSLDWKFESRDFPRRTSSSLRTLRAY